MIRGSAPPSPVADRRIAGLDEWRGVLILLVMLGHFLGTRAYELTYHHAYEPVQALTRQGGTAPAAAGLVAPALPHSSAEGVPVQGWALDPTSQRDVGVTGVRVSFGDGPFHEARFGHAMPGFAATPWRVDCGWVADLDARALRPGHEVPVRVLVRLTSGVEVPFAGGLRWRGTGTALTRVRWTAVAAQAAVDHFFVISGFLITLILVRTKGRPGYLRIFWARRALRILPLAWVLVGVVWLASPDTRGLLPPYLLLYANYLDVHVPALSPMWSLMVEEQFYLVFPVVCWLVPRRWLWVAVGGVCLAAAALRLHLPTSYVDGVYIAVPYTHLRVLALALGCWMALLREGLVPRPRLCSAVFIAWVALWAAYGGPEPLFAQYGRLGLLDPLSLLAAVLLLRSLLARPRPGPAWLRFLGVRCYGLYLLHVPMLHLFGALAPGLSPVPFFLAWFPAVVGLAALSYRWFETPLLALAPRYPPPA